MVNDRDLLFAGKEDIYSVSASYSEPSIPAVIDLAKEFGYGDTLFLADNALTGEIFICGTNKTLAYDYKYSTVSEIDAALTGAGMVRDPVTDLNVFLLGHRTQVELEGLENPSGGYFLRNCALFKYSYDEPSDYEYGDLGNIPQVFHPSGYRRFVRETAVGGVIHSKDSEEIRVTYDSIVESGWMDFNQRLDEKDYRMYALNFESEPTNLFIRESVDDSGSTSTAVLPRNLPFSLSPIVFPTYVEDRLALSEAQE